MINIAVCDDDEVYCRKIKDIVSVYCDENNIEYQIDLFLSGNDFLMLKENPGHYHIIYLDINMEGFSGIEVAEKLRRWGEEIYIIFVTSHIDFALEGYKVEALRYILKDNDNLPSAIKESLDIVLEKINLKSSRIAFSFREGVREIPLEQIVMIESRLHLLLFTVYAKSTEITYTMASKLSDVENMFPDNFVRIHQSFLINLKYVRDVSNYQAKLFNGKEIPISRGKYSNIKKQFLLYEGEF